MTRSNRARWGLVSTSGVLTGFGHGFAAFAVSALLKPMALDLDTGRGAISTAIGLGRFVAGMASPSIGRITDAYGTRLIVIAGMVVSAIGLFLLAAVRSEIELYIVWSLVFSVGIAAGFTVALDKLVVATAADKGGMALAVRFSISAVVATLIVPLVTTMIEHLGWRQTCVIWGGIILLLIPIPYLFFGIKPGTDVSPSAVKDGGEAAAPARSVLRQPAFWIIAGGLTAQASVTTGLSVHLVPLMTDFGLDPVFAATLFGGMVLLTVPVRLLAGYIADHVLPATLPIVLGALLVLEGLAIGSFALAPSFGTMLVVIGALGVAAGAPMVLVLILCAELFGRSGFATVQGNLMMVQVPGTMLAPIVAGYVHDFTGSYVPVVAGFCVLLVMGGAGLGLLKARG
ncbi:MFS transporter [Devosia albogilva]|uniref:MFS transporter n=1 Tax=Devosia albogilva TaxID=429726 RepID=A0ABW5QHC9_9HYPH